MVRPLRLEYPGAVYHVMSRGDARKSITRAPSDRQLFLDVLDEARKLHNILIHGYCLMTNHYHLLIETPDGNISNAMRYVNGVYTQRSNARNKTVGHIFQGRYKATLVERDEYLLELCRYIVLNPVRAGLVASPEDWPWSSYRALVGMDAQPSSFLETDWILAQFSKSRLRAQELFRDFVFDGISCQTRPFNEVVGGCILGSQEFRARFDEAFWDADEMREIDRRHRYANRPPLSSLFAGAKQRRSRNLLIREAVIDFGYSQREIANYLGLHHTTVCRALGDYVTKR
jgi:REP element-mobilizing transposase RayT